MFADEGADGSSGREGTTTLELNRLYNMDCMQGMKEFPDGFFDIAIVDPPYGIGIDGQKESVSKNPKHNRKAHARKNWDSQPPPAEYFRELERVSKNQVIWGGNYFLHALNQNHKGWLVWDKGQHGLCQSDCELAYTSFDTPTRVIVMNRVELLKEGTIHPTQKPVKLYSWVLSLFAKPGMKILDTHAGSASSLVACHQYGGGWITSALNLIRIITPSQRKDWSGRNHNFGYLTSRSRKKNKQRFLNGGFEDGL